MAENTVTCELFLLCENEATGVVEHPILGYVPGCKRCATKLDAVLIPAEFEIVEV